jgi:DNA-directed RNA polymerase subunit alpha
MKNMRSNAKIEDSFFISCKECRIENPRNFYGCFYLGPFKQNQSLTVANAIRRTLLSEIHGFAITSVYIEGADHEYSTLPGVRDTVIDILLNLKEIVFKVVSPVSTSVLGYLQARGPGVVRASDLKLPNWIQIIDPDQYIATLAHDGNLNLQFMLYEGENYQIQTPKSIQENNKNFNILKNKLPLSVDPVFMSINKVNYVIESDELHLSFNQTFNRGHIIILEIWTNGSIHPREALYEALRKLLLLFSKVNLMKFVEPHFNETIKKSNQNVYKILSKIQEFY